MTTPTRREWFFRRGRDWGSVWSEEAKSVADLWWKDIGTKPCLRVTAVNDEWYCLDGWQWDGKQIPDLGMLPTEADIPVGFS